MRSFPRLVLPAVLFALGVLLLSGVANGPPLTRADVQDGDVTANILVVPDGGLVTVTVIGDDDDADSPGDDLVITATDDDADFDESLVITDCDHAEGADFNPGDSGCTDSSGTTTDAAVTITNASLETTDPAISPDDTPENYTVTLQMTAECSDGPEVITVRGAQNSDTDTEFAEITIVCLPDPNITIQKIVDGTDADFAFRFLGGANNCWVSLDGGAPVIVTVSPFDFTLADLEVANFWCEILMPYVFGEPSAETDAEIVCVGPVLVIDSINDAVAVNFTSEDDDVTCQFINDNIVVTTPVPTETPPAGGGGVSPDPDATPFPFAPLPALLSLSVSPTNIACGAQATVTARLVYSNGEGVKDVIIGFSATRGTVFGNILTNSNGSVTTSFIAPPSPTTSTITASVDGHNQSVNVDVTCGTASPTAVAAVRPPSTGSGGLTGGAGDGWLVYAGAFFVTVSLIAAFAFRKQRI